MLGTIDAIKRPLKIPPRFIPYMERHRIYELFYEIGKQLVIKQPTDHVLYVKQCLEHAARSRDAPRIVLLSPIDFDRKLLAENLDLKMGIKPIYLDDLDPFQSPDEFVSSVRNILRKLYFEKAGWIFVDFPRNKLEARLLQNQGILPTHVIEIIWTDPPMQCHSSQSLLSKLSLNTSQSSYSSLEEDTDSLIDLRELYSRFLIQVDTAGRTYDELGEACIALTKKKSYPTPCVNFRVVLIGPRGSGRRSVAKYLEHRYNLEFIDFEYLMEQTRLQKNALGQALRCLDQWGIRAKSDIKIKIIENKLMSNECLKKGWVLFGYPITVEDFKLLDLLPTPPNRIVVIDVDKVTCEERLFSRRFNVITGSEHNVNQTNDLRADVEMETHFKDYQLVVKQSLEEYFTNVESLVRYAGESAIIVDGMVSEVNVREKVESCLSRAPSAPVRMRRVKREIKPEDIEFEPDDPQDFRIYEGLRQAESVLSLV